MHTATSAARFAFLTLVSGALLACGAEPSPAPTPGAEQRIEAWPLPIQDGAAQPDLALAPDGRILLSWIHNAPGRRPALQIAEWHPDGHWEGPRTVVVGNAMFVNWADTPHIAATADRALWVHWLQKSADAPYAYDVKLARSLDHGMNWSAPRTVHDDATTTEHGFVAFWPQGESQLGVAWLDGRNTASANAQTDPKPHGDAHEGHDGHGGGAMTLRAAVFDSALQARAESEIDARTCDCCQTDAAAIGNGALLVYRGRSQDEIRDIYATRFDGKAWTKPARVHADDWTMPACPVNGPAVAAHGESAVVAWYTAADDTPMVKLALSRDGGANFAAPIVLDRGEAVQGRVAVALDGRRAWALWLREEAGKQSLWLSRYAPDLVRELQRTKLADLAGQGRGTGFPRLALTDTALYAVWTDVVDAKPRLQGARIVPPSEAAAKP
jgi:hypothetical protein